MKPSGTVYLVGAGPGSPGLLTLRGAELLRRADVVVYDALVNAELLHMAPPGAEIIFGGKRSGEHSIPQEELNQLLIQRARSGKTVVRLKGGDPYVFGRGGEEACQLVSARIPFEVVPGVSSFMAAPSYAGIPLTHRDFASCLTIITGHHDPVEGAPGIDWPHLAHTPGTIVVMMGTAHIGEIASILVANGKQEQTPVALIRWGTTGHQQTISGTLATIAAEIARSQFGPPTIAVIGEVVNLRSKLNWFENRPLFGQRIVVTRSTNQAGSTTEKLSELGADVIEIPTIRFENTTRTNDFVDALVELNSYDWLIFTSPNGVRFFFDLFFKRFQDLRDLGGARIAAVGPATAKKLKELHLQVDLMPEEAIGAQIAKAFAKNETIENLKMCILRAEVANPDLPMALEALGAIVDDIACYQTLPVTDDITGSAARFLESGADWVLFSSGSTVEHFHSRFNLPLLLNKFPQLKIASIGPETSKVLQSIKVKPHLEARTHTMDGLIASLLSHSSAVVSTQTESAP
ncbi:MAG: uroporphyrinogen-III C-methyltransferase [Verrucomicrobiota bacterium]